jgi:hypothetical protein
MMTHFMMLYLLKTLFSFHRAKLSANVVVRKLLAEANVVKSNTSGQNEAYTSSQSNKFYILSVLSGNVNV